MLFCVDKNLIQNTQFVDANVCCMCDCNNSTTNPTLNATKIHKNVAYPSFEIGIVEHLNEFNLVPKQKTNTKGGVAAWPDVQKSGPTLGNLTPADRHGSVQVR